MGLQIPALRPGRRIEGVSALLLPYTREGRADWDTYSALVERTFASGLTPAANMDTGFVNLLTPEERRRALTVAAETARGRSFIAGAFLEGGGSPATLYLREVEVIRSVGATPILFPCSALSDRDDEGLFAVYREVAGAGAPLLAFELGTMFASFGRLFSIAFFRRLLDLPAFVGLKHSSLDRGLEWERLAVRDAQRPDFKLFTGNDLAIDMAFYGSDYLLGLSAFWPEAFAARDRLWAASDPRAVALNDLLQYLGFLAFREPVPAYKHSAAQFLSVRGILPSDAIHPLAPRRTEADLPLLRDLVARIGRFLEALP